MSMHANGFWLGYMGLVGACLGSFSGVLVARLPAAESVIWPRSRCGGCQQQLAWYDNLPLLSYLWLRGRCRSCQVAYGARTLVLELSMAALSAALTARLGLGFGLVLWLPVVTLLLATVFLDMDYFWVPDALTYPCMIWLALAALVPGGQGPWAALMGLAPAALLWGFMYVFARLAGHEGMGLGDLKLLGVFGLGLGWHGASMVLFWACVQGSVGGGLLLLAGGHRGKLDAPMPLALADDADWVPPPRAVPFGPFLVLAGLEVLLYPAVFLEGHARLSLWLVEAWLG